MHMHLSLFRVSAYCVLAVCAVVYFANLRAFYIRGLPDRSEALWWHDHALLAATQGVAAGGGARVCVCVCVRERAISTSLRLTAELRRVALSTSAVSSRR